MHSMKMYGVRIIGLVKFGRWYNIFLLLRKDGDSENFIKSNRDVSNTFKRGLSTS